MNCIYPKAYELIKAAPRQNQQNDRASSEDSDQTGHSPSLIRVFPMHFMGTLGPNASSCGQRRLWSDWVDAQADLSLRWVHMPFCWFCHEAAKSCYLIYPKEWPYLKSICIRVFFVCSRLASLSTIFQSCHDGVYLQQGAQCSLLYRCLTEVSWPRHFTWYQTQSHYPDTGSTSPSSTP